MDRDTITNLLKNTSTVAFDRVVDIILEHIFALRPVNIDGKGDGGHDRRLYTDTGRVTSAAVAVTTQQKEWKSKAEGDARKAVSGNDITIFYFFTNRDHDPAELRTLETRLGTATRIPVHCLGGREIADLVISAKLEGKILDALEIPRASPRQSQPDIAERALFSYIVLSPDVRQLRASVVADSILNCLFSATRALSRADLVSATTDFLGATAKRTPQIERAIDSLLTRGHLHRLPSGNIELSEAARRDLTDADRLYDAQLSRLTEEIRESLSATSAGIAGDSLKDLSLLLARAHVARTIRASQRTGLQIQTHGQIVLPTDPIQEIRDLLAKAGVPTQSLEPTLQALVDLSSRSELIHRLTRGAVFAWLESAGEQSAAIALGSRNWEEITVILDTSAAVPYLCARLFQPTKGRWSRAAHEAVMAFQQRGSSLRIPYFYLRECASHLCGAWRAMPGYDALADRYGEVFAHSGNGFISCYAQLKQIGADAPDSLEKFLKVFSANVGNDAGEWKDYLRRVQGDLQPKFSAYGIAFEPAQYQNDTHTRQLEQEYAFALERRRRTKARVLIENDVTTLAHLRRSIGEQNRSMVCLTWDGTMIEVAKDYMREYGWVVTPEVAADFVEFSAPHPGRALMVFSFELARVSQKPTDLVAHIIDRVAKYATERLADWRFQDRLEEFKKDYLASVDVSKVTFDDELDAQIDRFLSGEGIHLAGRMAPDEEASPSEAMRPEGLE
jgi:hypothetical protein